MTHSSSQVINKSGKAEAIPSLKPKYGTLNKIADIIISTEMSSIPKEIAKLSDVKCVVYAQPLNDNPIKIVFNDGVCFIIRVVS